MARRPASIVAIAWIVIASQCIFFYCLPGIWRDVLHPEGVSAEVRALAAHDLLSPAGMLALSLGLTAMDLVLAIGFLRGVSWARRLYVGWNAVMIPVQFVVSGAKWEVLPDVAVFVIVTPFLFRPEATAYFAAPPPLRIGWREAGATLVFMIAGGLFALIPILAFIGSKIWHETDHRIRLVWAAAFGLLFLVAAGVWLAGWALSRFRGGTFVSGVILVAVPATLLIQAVGLWVYYHSLAGIAPQLPLPENAFVHPQGGLILTTALLILGMILLRRGSAAAPQPSDG